MIVRYEQISKNILQNNLYGKEITMSKYTHEQEVEIVKDAMMLTAAIKIGEEELSKQKCKKFKAKPTTPVHKQLEVPKVTN